MISRLEVEKTSPMWHSTGILQSISEYRDPIKLEENVARYFKWCEDNPIYRNETVKKKEEVTVVPVPTMRPYTISGLALFLGVSITYLRATYRELTEKMKEGTATDEESALLRIFEAMQSAVITQQIEGGMAGIFSPALVTKLIEREAYGYVDQDVVGPDVSTKTVRITVKDKDTAIDIQRLDELL